MSLRLSALAALIVAAALVMTQPRPAFAIGFVADNVLGQSGSFTSQSQGTTATTMNGSHDAVVDSIHHRLFTSELSNNRILVFNLNNDNTLPDDTADYVIGQPDFTTSTPGISQSKMNNPAQAGV